MIETTHIGDTRRGGFPSESGSSLVELALVVPVLLLVLLGAYDLGNAYYVTIELSRASHTAALYGTMNPTDVAGMKSASVADAPDLAGFGTQNVTVSTGCECSDGSSPVLGCSSLPTCATNQVTYIQVVSSATYTTLFKYPGVPSPLNLTGSARMRAMK